MMTLEAAGGRRFVVGGPFDYEMPYYYIMITDVNFWFDNEPAIYDWMDDNLPRGRMHQEGMVVVLEQEKDVTAFIMRWA
jgi:hypothetical protein